MKENAIARRKTLLLAIIESWKLAWVYGIGLESGENRENGYLKLEIGRNWKLFRNWKKLEIVLESGNCFSNKK